MPRARPRCSARCTPRARPRITRSTNRNTRAPSRCSRRVAVSVGRARRASGRGATALRRRRVDRPPSRTSPRRSRQDLGEDLPDLPAPPPELCSVADRKLLRRHTQRDAPALDVVGDTVSKIRQRDRLASAALHLLADLGSVVELELLLVAEVSVFARRVPPPSGRRR